MVQGASREVVVAIGRQRTTIAMKI
jgi:hypothetical protein